jgi:hypothetical protein
MRNLFGRPVSDYLFGSGVAAAASAFLVTAAGYSQEARAFPAPVALLLLALSALDLVGLTDTAAGKIVRRSLNPTIKEPGKADPVSTPAAAMLWLAALVAALMLLGIEMAVPLYLFVSLRFRARRSWRSSLAIATGVSAPMWLLLVAALRLELYRGYLLTRFFSAG